MSTSTSSLPLLPSFTQPISFERMIRERFLVPNEQILQKYFPSSGSTSFPVFVYIKLDAPEPPNFFTAASSTSSSSSSASSIPLPFSNNNNNNNFSNTQETLGPHCLNTFDPKAKLARNFVQEDAYLRAAAFFLPPLCSSFLRMYCAVVVQFNTVSEGGLFLFGVSICESVTRHNSQRGITTRTFVRRGDRKWTPKNPLPTSRIELAEVSKRMRTQSDVKRKKKRRIDDDEDDANELEKNTSSKNSDDDVKNKEKIMKHEMILTASKTIFEQGGSTLQKFRTFSASKNNIIYLSPRLLLSHFRIKSQLKTFISDDGIFFFQNILDRSTSILDSSFITANNNINENSLVAFPLEISCAQMFSHIWDRVPSVKLVAKKITITRLNQIRKQQQKQNCNDDNDDDRSDGDRALTNINNIRDDGQELKENSTTGIIQLIGTCCHLASRLNFRGAAIVTKKKICEENNNDENSVEEEHENYSTHHQPVPIQILTRTYLNILLREFSRRICRTLVEVDHPSNNPCFEPKTIPKNSDAEVWLYGSADNLNHLLDNLQKWMSCSTRGGENASSVANASSSNQQHQNQAKTTASAGGVKSYLLIDRVKLSIIPWLVAIEQGNNHRSARLQQTFTVFWTWMTVFIIPFWIKKSFHVTYSPRQSSLLLFYLLEDWYKWMADVLKPDHRTELSEALMLFGQDNRSGPKSEKPTSAIVVKGFGPTPLNAATRRSLKNRTAKSPLAGSALFYSSVRWLPAGSNKLRPISLIRCGSAKALGRIAIQKPLLQQRLQSSSSSSTSSSIKKSFSSSSSSVTLMLLNNKDKSIQFLDRSPNRTVLRKALFCLYSGLRERRLTVSEPGISRGTPAEDYAEILPFVRKLIYSSISLNNTTNHNNNRSSSASSSFPKIHFIKADASKCFDLLSQNTVREMITHLVPHDRYQMLEFDAVVKLTARPNSKIQHVAVVNSNSNSNIENPNNNNNNIFQIAKQASVGGVYLYRTRRWTKTLSIQEFRDGFVPCIPKGWIVEAKPFASETVSGEWVRQVLNEHTQNHLRVIQGRLYQQAVGIPQGSTVSSVICDACLSTVDNDIAEILERRKQEESGDDDPDDDDDDNESFRKVRYALEHEYDPVRQTLVQVVRKKQQLQTGRAEEDSSASSASLNVSNNNKKEHFNLTLRRMDDLLILSTNEDTINECKQRIIRGWPDIGFVCNEEKLIVSSSTDEENSSLRQVVPWCGLLLHCFNPPSYSSSNSSSLALRRCLRFPIEGSIDWSRVDIETLARACMINPQQESSLMIGVFRAIKSIQMRFSPCCICATMNSKKRVAQNLLEVFTCIASVFCEMLLLTLNATRPHPRVFFRARVAAEACIRTHCMSHLAGIALKNNSCGYSDGLIFHLCEVTSFMAFSRVIMMYQNHKWPSWFKLRGAAYIACGAFVETLKKRQEYYGIKMRKLRETRRRNLQEEEEMEEDFEDVYDEAVFEDLRRNLQKSKEMNNNRKNHVPFTVVSARN